jgi:hypothetical protein
MGISLGALTGADRTGRIQANAAQEAANAAQAEENARQARIKQGQSSIDSTFGQFDNNYYKGYGDKYTGYYNPQVDKQYADAKDALTARLAGNGTLESSVGAKTMGDLSQQYADQKATIANQAIDAANGMRGKVEGARAGLYAANQSAGDPSQIASQAQAQATSLVAPTSYSPLSNLFGSLLSGVATFKNGQATGGSFAPTYTSNFGTPGQQQNTSGSSARVVR